MSYKVGEGCFIDKGAVIEKDAYIRHGVIIANDTDRPTNIRIESGAFIGSGSVIVNDVVIAKNAVILAGSLVDRDIPEGEIWGGNPINRRYSVK